MPYEESGLFIDVAPDESQKLRKQMRSDPLLVPHLEHLEKHRSQRSPQPDHWSPYRGKTVGYGPRGEWTLRCL